MSVAALRIGCGVSLACVLWTQAWAGQSPAVAQAPVAAQNAPAVARAPAVAANVPDVVPNAPAAQATPAAARRTPTAASDADTLTIDLPSALRLAGARNLDIKLAEQRLAEATASHKMAIESFFPSVSPGIAYRGHDNAIQDVIGDIQDVHKQSYAPGVTIVVQTDVGDAIFKSLAARQTITAAGAGLDAQRQDSIVATAAAYFELVRAHASIAAAEEALRISSGYAKEVEQAVEIGIAFKGDALRARVQAQDDTIALRSAQEQQRVAAARLAFVMNLDSLVQLVPRDPTPLPLGLVSTDGAIEAMVAAALSARPEMRQRAAELAAAGEEHKGVVYGPLVPSVGAQIFAGGLGGGRDGGPHEFDDSQDYYAGLSWRIGPGGLFDAGRIEQSRARARSAALRVERTRQEITEQVVSGRERVASLQEQVAVAERSLHDARQALDLRQQRKEFGVGAVLETIEAERDWTRALLGYLAKVTDSNKVQYELLRATGALADSDVAAEQMVR